MRGLSGWVYVDMRGRDLRRRRAATCSGVVADKCSCRPGYSIAWSGQFEYLERAREAEDRRAVHAC